MKITLLLSLLAATVAAAQPIDAKGELWYPTNPPRKVDPGAQTPSPAQKAPTDTAAQGKGNTIQSPEDMFLSAYRQVTMANKSIAETDYDQARKSLTQALTSLEQLGKLYPQWQPQIVKFRLDSTQKLLSSLPSK